MTPTDLLVEPLRDSAVPALRPFPLIINALERSVVLYGDELPRMSDREFSLLAHLARDPLRVYTKHELLRDVWGFKASASSRAVDTMACRVRTRLRGNWILNSWGVGYRLTDQPGMVRLVAAPEQSEHVETLLEAAEALRTFSFALIRCGNDLRRQVDHELLRLKRQQQVAGVVPIP